MPDLTILGWGTAVPRFQLTGMSVGAVLGGAGRKSRAVASYDEDTTTLAASAARAATRSCPEFAPRSVVVATSTPAYAVKSPAATVHAALALPARTRAVDAGASTRAGVTALLTALEGRVPTVVALADARLERAGAPGELDGGDAAAAFLVGDSRHHQPIARLAGAASSTVEVMDRWQLPAARFGVQADERATESAYLGAAEEVLDELFAAEERRADVLVVASEHKRVRGALAARTCITAGRTVTGVAGLGCAGAADAGLLLAHALESAVAGERVLLVALADGADALLFDVLADGATNPAPTVAVQLAAARTDLPYPTYLSWRGLLDRDSGRRPPLAAPAPVPALRSAHWKYGLIGALCRKCETVQLPPERVCRTCGTVDEMDEHPLADRLATVLRVTTDWLAWSPQPPLIQAIVEFDGGGRLRCEVADAFDGDVRDGDRVAMSFRVLRTVEGIHNYFWKAVPVRERAEANP